MMTIIRVQTAKSAANGNLEVDSSNHLTETGRVRLVRYLQSKRLAAINAEEEDRQR